MRKIDKQKLIKNTEKELNALFGSCSFDITFDHNWETDGVRDDCESCAIANTLRKNIEYSYSIEVYPEYINIATEPDGMWYMSTQGYHHINEFIAHYDDDTITNEDLEQYNKYELY